MITQSEFKPAWWIPGPHGQTIWPYLARRRQQISTTRERFELPDGDFVDCDWAGKTNTGPLIIVLHGLEGSVNSHYAKGLLQSIVEHGWTGVLMHFRGCSGEPNRMPRAYHSGETRDFDTFLNTMSARYPDRPLFAVGYSLGGNVLLKWLGETGQQHEQTPLRGAVAVSVPFELAKAVNRVNRGVSRIYQNYLLKKLKVSVAEKLNRKDYPIDDELLPKLIDFWSFDHHVTAPLHGFESAAHYYDVSSSRQYLKHIQTPTLIIHAKDDPFMTPECIPTDSELAPEVTLELSNKGGHVGFVTGLRPRKPIYWLEQRIPAFIKTKIAS